MLNVTSKEQLWAIVKAGGGDALSSADRQLPHPLPLVCLHEGQVLSWCASGSDVRHVRDCELHGSCTRGEAGKDVDCVCARCSDMQRWPAPEQRHLLYHIYPRRGSRWRRPANRVLEALDGFNTAHIAVATDKTTDNFDWVSDVFAGTHAQLFEVRNDPHLREVATFRQLFERVEGCRGATLWAHAKGSTRPAEATSDRWADVLAELMLNHWPSVSRLLARYAVCGCFQKLGAGWSSAESQSNWHYSGSWFWFRNDQLFSRPDWGHIDQFWGGIEPYPSLHFAAEDAGCLFHRRAVPEMNLYNQGYWDHVVEPELAAWRREHGEV